jgi:ATP-dependent Lon protease
MEKLAEEQPEYLNKRISSNDMCRRQVSALFSMLSSIYGADKLVLKAGKLEALKGMRSDSLEEQILALQKIVYEDPTLDGPPSKGDVPRILNEIEEEIADLIARRTVEDTIEKKINERMQKRHDEYMREIRNQVVHEDAGPESAQTLKKLAILEKLNRTRLSKSAIEVLRPSSLSEVVGQDRAICALLTKLASPYPQHVILYGPPGVGKTTVARLALQEAKRLPQSPFGKGTPFVEVDGATLRWDPREATNPLLGSVHDPIYQGARRELAEGGVPEPKTGLVTEAHGGVLFIDEIAELDPMLQNKLLKVLEDKKVTFDSSYYDPHDSRVPRYIKKLFEEGAPADFVLIGATTRDPSEVSPALRSRCAEVFFEPLSPLDIQRIVLDAAGKLAADLAPEIPEIIAEYTMEGRKAIGILADGYSVALYQKTKSGEADKKTTKKGRNTPLPEVTVLKEHVFDVLQSGRFSPTAYPKAHAGGEVGKAFGLAVSGYMGSVLEIEAVAFPARQEGKGTLRFNETAGSMAKDSVFNAASVIRSLTGVDIASFDIHVNVVGGGRIDGPSAGVAVLVAVISAIKGIPVRQDVGLTGEISIQGKVKAVGGVLEKIYGARLAGLTKVLLPSQNLKDVPAGLKGIEIVPVETAKEVLEDTLAQKVI